MKQPDVIDVVRRSLVRMTASPLQLVPSHVRFEEGSTEVAHVSDGVVDVRISWDRGDWMLMIGRDGAQSLDEYWSLGDVLHAAELDGSVPEFDGDFDSTADRTLSVLLAHRVRLNEFFRIDDQVEARRDALERVIKARIALERRGQPRR